MYFVIALTLLAMSPPGGQTDLTSPVVAEAVIGAPPLEVWDAFTTREGIEGWQVARASELELRPGARWRTSYSEDSNLDDDSVIESEVLAVDPGRMLAMRTTRPPAGFPFPQAILETWSVLYLEAVGPTSTRVTVRMFGFNESAASREMRAFFEWGNADELEKLANHFANPTN